jgi:hypothetical protein
MFSLLRSFKSSSVRPAHFFEVLWNWLAIRDQPSKSDLIFVLAGLQERKAYGLELFRKGFAPRLILSVARSEVRKMDHLGFLDLNLRDLTSRLPPSQRHFFIDLSDDVRRVRIAGIKKAGTFTELSALATYLGERPAASLTLISTSIHLRRVRWCCRKSKVLCGVNISYLAVPEQLSSLRCCGWWRRLDHWAYVRSELVKLLAYRFLFRNGEDGIN